MERTEVEGSLAHEALGSGRTATSSFKVRAATTKLPESGRVLRAHGALGRVEATMRVTDHPSSLVASGLFVKLIRNPALGFVQVGEDRRACVVDAPKPGFHVPPARISTMQSGQPHEDCGEKPIYKDKLALLVIAARGNLDRL